MLPWWWGPQRMMSNSVPECEKDNLTGCVSFYTQWFDICVCIGVRGLHLISFCLLPFVGAEQSRSQRPMIFSISWELAFFMLQWKRGPEHLME